MKIIAGFILMAAGTLFMAKSEDIFKNFGRIAWFDKHLGAEGGSRLGYKLIGLIIVFFGLLLATGSLDGFLKVVLSPLMKGKF
ncbi:MAG: hypothetical protein ACOXZ1_03590 [Patescibacteria group bacterium]|jgi:hypothetical protein|nr:hypothetical protein [Patescibacteria group bacterium]